MRGQDRGHRSNRTKRPLRAADREQRAKGRQPGTGRQTSNQGALATWPNGVATRRGLGASDAFVSRRRAGLRRYTPSNSCRPKPWPRTYARRSPGRMRRTEYRRRAPGRADRSWCHLPIGRTYFGPSRTTDRPTSARTCARRPPSRSRTHQSPRRDLAAPGRPGRSRAGRNCCDPNSTLRLRSSLHTCADCPRPLI